MLAAYEPVGTIHCLCTLHYFVACAWRKVPYQFPGFAVKTYRKWVPMKDLHDSCGVKHVGEVVKREGSTEAKDPVELQVICLVQA